MKQLASLAMLLCVVLTSSAQGNPDQIKLNQIGYYVNGPKIAVFTGDTSIRTFSISAVNGKNIVFNGVLSAVVKSAYSTTFTRIADFSSFQKPGNYILTVTGAAKSYPFSIRNKVHASAAVASIKGFYYQRVSMPLEEKYAGKWARTAGHPDTEVLIHPAAVTDKRPVGFTFSSPGGWYDAGDYNKYIVNSGITMGTMLSAYEDFSAYFDTLNVNLPESNNKIPDLLDEVLYNLRWMLTMQDPDDGGVYNKCTNAAFDGMVMPGVTKLPRYVVPKGTAATLDFAAVMAQAARILAKFEKQLPGLKDSCLKAAALAWAWAEKNPSLEYNQNTMNKNFQPAVSTGGYGDRVFTDEWFWAAAELLATTNDLKYVSTIKERWNDSLSLPSWNNVRALGYYTLIRNEKNISNASLEIASLKQVVKTMADAFISNGGNKAFQTIMGQSRRDFIWGSSSVAANQGILLINVFQFTNDKKYVEAGLSNLDYILGRNATGYCLLTGSGTKSTMRPHHRPSVADGIEEPVPGLLSGGPNPGRQDNCKYVFTETETCYLDESCSYASNEIAINWNAPMVYLANAIEALQYKVKFSK